MPFLKLPFLRKHILDDFDFFDETYNSLLALIQAEKKANIFNC